MALFEYNMMVSNVVHCNVDVRKKILGGTNAKA